MGVSKLDSWEDQRSGFDNVLTSRSVINHLPMDRSIDYRLIYCNRMIFVAVWRLLPGCVTEDRRKTAV